LHVFCDLPDFSERCDFLARNLEEFKKKLNKDFLEELGRMT